MENLQTFENPDETFNVVPYDSGIFNLEMGDVYFYASEDMSDEEIIEWGEDQGYLDNEEDGYMDEDGNPMVDSLRDLKRSHEEDYLPTHATPSGRAFLYFEEIDLPESIKVQVVDGLYPGNDWQGVIIESKDQLVLLQEYLLEKGIKVNFILE
ncbi:MAG: hypothetical protein ACK5AO_04480 [bacterium]|jgi:hypothetical protein